MNFIKRIFEGEIDSSVHLQFQKFSKGRFENRAMIEAKFSAGKYKINTTPEFANEMVESLARKLGDEKANVKGAIVSTLDLGNEIEFKDKKQFQGVKRYLIENEMSGAEILDLLEKFPKCFFALSFETGDSKLKIKPKAPKSGKPGSKGEKKPVTNFCKLMTQDPELGKDFIFEKPDFKEAEINHTFIIDEIKIPEDVKKTGDFKKMREEAIRKGKIIRNAIIDGKEVTSEKEFEA